MHDFEYAAYTLGLQGTITFTFSVPTLLPVNGGGVEWGGGGV